MERSRIIPERLVRIATLGVALLGTGIPGRAAAQELTTRLGLAGQVGGALVAMENVNERIRAGNDFLERKGWKELDEIKIGFNFTGDVRGRITGPLWASLGIGHTFSRSGVDFDEVITIRPSGSYYSFRLLYDLPYRPRPRMYLRLGAGPLDMPSARLLVEHEARRVEGGVQRIEKVEFKGKGWGGQGQVELEYLLNAKTTLVADLGYRYLRIDRDGFTWSISDIILPDRDDDEDGVPNKYDLDEVNGIVGTTFLEVVKDPDGRPQVINAQGEPRVVPRNVERFDFSGPVLNVGLRYYLF